MLKNIVYILVFLIGGGIAVGGFHLCRVHFKNKKEMKPYSGAKTEVTKDLGKVLVIYYSLSGNTRSIAEKIKEKTSADIYEIKTEEVFSSGLSLSLDVRKQLKSGKYPRIPENFPEFSSYDLIIVGSPVWWYTAATPVLSFLARADFKSKKVAFFSTQGSNPGNFAEDFKAKAVNANIIGYMGFNNLSKKYDQAVDNKIAVWLNTFDIK